MALNRNMPTRGEPRPGDPQHAYDSTTGGWTRTVTDPHEKPAPSGRDSGLRKPTH